MKLRLLKQLILTLALFGVVSADWRQYPQGKQIEITIEHEFLSDKDSVCVTHYHKSESKWYVVLCDSTEIYVDKIRELK